MLLSLLLVSLIAAGGAALTYAFEREETFLWRTAAGAVIGSAIFGTVAFLLAMAFGLSGAVVISALLLTLSPMLLLIDRGRRKLFERDWAKAKGKLQGSSGAKALRFVYYAGFFVLFVFFFDRAMIETAEGIFTGGSNNLGDLPFHLGAIYGFVDGANFPPQNPSFAGAKFSYPFIADFVTAGFVKFGVGVRDAMFVQNVAWAFSLLVLLEAFVRRLVGDGFAAKLAPPLLFFSGGLGFVWFFSDYAAQSRSFFEFLNALPKDYTIGNEFRWGNSLITLFITQRSLLLGMPITLIVLGFLWKIFATEKTEERKVFSSLAIGLIAGMLPLVHLHSLAVLFVVTAFFFAMNRNRWRDFIAFGVGVCVLAIPALLWSMSGSATRATEFFAWHFGFDSGETNIVWFWIKNTGLFIPLIAFGVYLKLFPQSCAIEGKRKKEKGKKEAEENISHGSTGTGRLVLFCVPFAFLFILANVAKLAPWEWDNIKVLIYWFVGSLPFVVFALTSMWRGDKAWRAVAAVCFAALIASGALDVWRTVSGQINYRVFDADAVTIANRIKAVTPRNAVFLNAPTYNTAIVLSGRRSLIRYPGHLSSHGIEYREREEDVKRIYRGGPDALGLMEKYGIEYVLISPEERSAMAPNEAYFAKYPVVAEVGQYRVHKITK